MEVENLSELIQKLNSLGSDATPVIQAQMVKATRWVRDDARLRCPVDTGDLRKSITPSVQKTQYGAIGTVSTNMEYAAYVEFGTGQKGQASNKYPGITYRQDWSGMEAQPYLYPALADNKQEVIDHFFKKPLQDMIAQITRR